jgi:hypothetical protein
MEVARDAYQAWCEASPNGWGWVRDPTAASRARTSRSGPTRTRSGSAPGSTTTALSPGRRVRGSAFSFRVPLLGRLPRTLTVNEQRDPGRGVERQHHIPEEPGRSRRSAAPECYFCQSLVADSHHDVSPAQAKEMAI